MPAINCLPFLASIPPATRYLTITLLAFSLLGAFLRITSSGDPQLGELASYGLFSPAPRQDYPWLFLVPGKVFYYPWTLLIAGFAEGNLIEFAISALALPLCARYLERVWGARELLKFVVVVIVSSNIIAVGLSWILFFVFGKADVFLYGSTIHGLSALQTGFLVAFTQLIPEHQVQLFGGVIKARVKRLPGIYLLVSNVLTILIAQNPYIIIQFGFFTGWVYLRFVKIQEGAGGEFRGDRSETFAFTSWFPPIAHKPIGALGNAVFNLCVKLKLVRPWGDDASGGYALLPGPGGARAEAERRRALALKALDARMASAPTNATAAAPTTSGAASSTTPPSAPAPATVGAGAAVSKPAPAKLEEPAN
ncbi:eukaryotic integral membrane protein-domain-containing protein [Mrakia frigida]|uniref:uncharacterized protein n=1 Tax=Mrakia frigida TaxID=29902 RepID=UPI003FCC1ECC